MLRLLNICFSDGHVCLAMLAGNPTDRLLWKILLLVSCLVQAYPVWQKFSEVCVDKGRRNACNVPIATGANAKSAKE